MWWWWTYSRSITQYQTPMSFPLLLSFYISECLWKAWGFWDPSSLLLFIFPPIFFWLKRGVRIKWFIHFILACQTYMSHMNPPDISFFPSSSVLHISANSGDFKTLQKAVVWSYNCHLMPSGRPQSWDKTSNVELRSNSWIH